MKVIRATAADAARLTVIAFAAKGHWGYPKEWLEGWSDILTMRPEFLEANVAYLAQENERAMGFYVLTRESDGLHLDHLWIAPAAMGRGLGRELFEHAAQEGRALGYTALRIEADPNAEQFYQRMGAKRVGLRRTIVLGTERELPLLICELDGVRRTSSVPA